MPQVPQYVSSQRAEITRARQNIRTSPDSFGAGVGRGLQQVGRGLDEAADAALRFREKDDAAKALEAYNEAAEKLRVHQRGEEGYLTLQGKDAYEGYDDAAAQVERIGQEATAELNDRQKEAFQNLWRSRRESALNSMSTHAANARQTYQSAQAQAVAEDAVANASENWASPDVINSDIARATISATAMMQGQPPEAIDNAVEEIQSNAWMAAIQGAQAAGQHQAAKGLFEKHKDKLRGDTRTAAQEIIEQGDLRVRTQEGADAVFDRFGPDLRAGMAYIRENYEGVDRDEIERRYQNSVSLFQQTEMEKGEYLFAQASEVLAKGGSINDIPPNVWVGMKASEREYLERAEQGIPSTTDVAAYTQYANMSPAELKKVDLAQARLVLDDPDYNRVVGWVRAAREDKAPDPLEVTEARTLNRQIGDAAKAAGLGDEETNAFYIRAQSDIAAFERAKGDKAAPEERQHIIDGLARKVRIEKPGIWNDVSGQAGTVSLSGDIPESMQSAVIAAFPEERIPQEAAVNYYREAARLYSDAGVTPTPAEMTAMIESLREGSE